MLFLAAQTVYPQFTDEIINSLQTKPRPTFRFDNRNSIISTRGARINSIKWGLEYNHVFTLGFGYEWLGSEINRNFYVQSTDGITDTVNSALKMNYMSLFAEYVFYRDKKWECFLPISFGIGDAHYSYEYNNEIFRKNHCLILVYETNITVQYRVIRWIGVGAGTGYRLMIKGNNMMDENFNSPIYILKMKIYFGDIYTELFKKGGTDE
ncbi:MAG: hypothetical protein ABIJ16_09145 [Bacteroidota bacterium]